MARSVAPAYLAEGSGGTLVNAFPTSGSSQSMEPEKVVGRPLAAVAVGTTTTQKQPSSSTSILATTAASDNCWLRTQHEEDLLACGHCASSARRPERSK